VFDVLGILAKANDCNGVEVSPDFFIQITGSPAVTFEVRLGDVRGQMHLFIVLNYLTLLVCEVLRVVLEVEDRKRPGKDSSSQELEKSMICNC
jgi:hypothetical protein